MSKLSPISLALLIVLPVLAGCGGSMQDPSKDQTITGPGDGVGSGYSSVTPGSEQGEGINGLVGRNGGMGADLMSNIDNPPAEALVVTVHFEFNQFNIRPSDRPALEAAGKKLAANPSLHVVAVGHTDWFGSDQYNLALGDRRANSVKGYLIKSGAKADQIQILSRGSLNATHDAKKNSPQAENDRRVDVVKIPAGTALPGAP